jgi:hypothetical protein
MSLKHTCTTYDKIERHEKNGRQPTAMLRNGELIPKGDFKRNNASRM